jgi:hypothetical protein
MPLLLHTQHRPEAMHAHARLHLPRALFDAGGVRVQVFGVRAWPLAYPPDSPAGPFNMQHALAPHNPAAPEPTTVHTPHGTPSEGDSIMGANQRVCGWRPHASRTAPHWNCSCSTFCARCDCRGHSPPHMVSHISPDSPPPRKQMTMVVANYGCDLRLSPARVAKSAYKRRGRIATHPTRAHQLACTSNNFYEWVECPHIIG